MSDLYQIAFAHIPKNAGTAVIEALKDKIGLENLLLIQGIESMEPFGAYFSFAFVRNPWSRMVSSYSYMKQVGINRSLDISVDHKTLEARERIINELGCDYGFKDYLLYRQRYSDISPLNQSDYICDSSGKLLVKFVGRVESAEDDLQKVYNHVGLGRASLPTVNKSDHADYRELYDDETREMVADMNRVDIEKFGYAF
jgi:hypothetical protein